jgi:hypothetical protein
MGKNTSTEISLPQSVSCSITCTTEPSGSSFNRFLTFQNFAGERIRLKMTFTKISPLELEVTAFPDTTHNLQVLGSLNHRAFWDKMYLENRGGSSAISIHRMSLTVHYVKGASGTELDIPLLTNRRISRTLPAEEGEIYLTRYTIVPLRIWAGISSRAHLVARMAAQDLGKSGTSEKGYDQFGSNPKYRGMINNECSEFASWYLHEAGLTFRHGKYASFKDITATSQLETIFKDLGKYYFYHNGQKKFLHQTTQAVYTPKAGDILMRRGGGKSEHSMIMISWDATNRTAKVINGPYPVTVRTVDVHTLEKDPDNPKDFVIGRVW